MPYPQLLLDLARDHRLGPEPLEHEGEALSGELEHERGLAAGLIERAAAMLREQSGRSERSGQGIALARVQRLVIDARGAIG